MRLRITEFLHFWWCDACGFSSACICWLWKFWIPSLVNCFIHKCSITKARNTAVRTTGITLLTQGNLAVTRPVNTADGRDTDVGLATLSRQPNDKHPFNFDTTSRSANRFVLWPLSPMGKVYGTHYIGKSPKLTWAKWWKEHCLPWPRIKSHWSPQTVSFMTAIQVTDVQYVRLNPLNNGILPLIRKLIQ
jgi:hypothetical protein